MTPAPGNSPGALRCSARGCRGLAGWGLRWRNPRLHGPDRLKVWTACDDHREHLAGFLAARGFLVDTVPLDALAPREQDLP